MKDLINKYVELEEAYDTLNNKFNQLNISITLEGEPYIVRVNSYRPADAGRAYGRPEDCRPPSGAEVDFDLACETSGCHADEVACRHYDMIVERIEEEYAAMEDDYEGA